MSILGSIGTLLSRMPVSEWIALAASAPTIISDAIKLGEDLKPVIEPALAALKGPPIANVSPQRREAHQQWTAAWTAADQRAADFEDGSRG